MDRPPTFRRSDIWCVLHVSDRVQGRPIPMATPQCFSGSYSRSLIGSTLRFRRLLTLANAVDSVDDLLIDELVDELLFEDELIPLEFDDVDEAETDCKLDDVSKSVLDDDTVLVVAAPLPLLRLDITSSLFRST